ncbi:unnamed protein product [Orchesella dallaii]|uniref:Uncharacterized protein n=1 Tax=Orchesella dallaii TaxID=48710 RepID=A0ABP1Q550_9HEXA
MSVTNTSGTGTTFRVFPAIRVKPKPLRFSTACYPPSAEFFKDLVQLAKTDDNSPPIRHKTNKLEVLQMSKLAANGIFEYSPNGFVFSVVNAYFMHYNLILRPDDVWFTIMTQFSLYINRNAEKYRKLLIQQEGRKELCIDGSFSCTELPYEAFVEMMLTEIKNNVSDPDFMNWMLPTFSTTTSDDKVALGILLMATMKHYFAYSYDAICGIPYITLEGTVEDWENLYNRLHKLQEYDLQWWMGMLQPILFQFVEAKRGNIDLTFWRQICRYKDNASCMLERQKPSIVSGWITAFSVIDMTGVPLWSESENFVHDKYGGPWPKISPDGITKGVVEVNVRTTQLDGRQSTVTLYAGHMCIESVLSQNALKPCIAWTAILDKTEEEDDDVEYGCGTLPCKRKSPKWKRVLGIGF